MSKRAVRRTRARSGLASFALAGMLGALTVACAAGKSSSAPASEPVGAQSYGQPSPATAAGASPQQQPSYALPPPPPAPQAEGAPAPPSTVPAQPGGGAASGTTNRSMALQSASNEIDASQRELDVAGSDCRNACRALGSMDRAAGHLCELSQGDGEGRRCDDAKRRVYSARDRVKSTCGACPNGPSVERAAPIPSLR